MPFANMLSTNDLGYSSGRNAAVPSRHYMPEVPVHAGQICRVHRRVYRVVTVIAR